METHSNEGADTLAGVYEALNANPASHTIDSIVKTLV
jgi:hypothetical protein